MRAVRIDAPGRLGVVDVPEPQAGSQDAIVEVAFAGICGSDVELHAGHRPADIARYPVVPGHEWSGVVVAVGDDVDPAVVGRKVVGEGFSTCGACARCSAGEAVICETGYDEIGFTRPGAWAERLSIPAAQLHLLRDDADLRSAAGLEPAACSADAVRRAAVKPGERVVVIGGGTIGSLAVQLLRAAEPSAIVVVEPRSAARDMSLRCGATAAIDPTDTSRLAGPVDVVIEASGAPDALSSAVQLLRRGGRLVIAGVPDPSVQLGAFDLLSRRVEVHTVFGAPHAAWCAATDAFGAGVLDPGLLVTHEFDLAAAGDALGLLSSGSHDVGKILLHPN